MNWQYIAGFFDGEGCIMYGMGQNSISITQKRNKVLYDIQKFLFGNDLQSHVYTTKSTGVSRLCISKTADTVRFLEGIFPYLIVKKVEAQDMLRNCKLYPSRSNRSGKHTWKLYENN